MRWLLAEPGPSFSVMDVYAGWREGLASVGQEVFDFNLGARLDWYSKMEIETDAGEKRKLTDRQAVDMALNGLAAALWKIQPRILFIVSGFFVDGQLLDHARNLGTRVVSLMTEQPYESERELKLAEHSDLVLLNDPVNLKAFEAVAPTVYAPHAYRPAVHCPGSTDEKPSDFAFCGTAYPSRVAFLEAMDLVGLDVALAGNWMRLDEDSPLRKYVVHPIGECFDNGDAVNLYRATKSSINLYRKEGESAAGWALGPREVELAATGTFFLREPRGEGDEALPMLPTFTDPEDAASQLRWWLDHDSQREAAAAKAREAIAERTFENHAAQLLRLLGVEE